MSALKVWVAALAVALTSPFGARAEPLSEPVIETYDIVGSTEAELREQMLTAGPIDKTEGKHFDATTTWRVTWAYRWERTGEGCRIFSVDTKLKSRIVLPRWPGAAAADPALRAKWEAFSAALLAHEKGHVAFGEGARAEAERAIKALPRFAACEDLDKAAMAAGNAAVAKAKADEIAYDRATHHGETQGAKW